VTIKLLLAHYFLLYFYPRTKYEFDRMNRFRDMAIQNYIRRLTAAILDLVQPELAPFDPPTSKTLLCRTKHEVDRMSRCRDMAIRNFPKCEVGRSVVGPQYIHCSHVLIFVTLGT